MQTLPHPVQHSAGRHLALQLWKPLLVFFIYSCAVIYLEDHFLDGGDLTVSADMQTVASLFLGSLMALRINTSYNKWWEARTLWGKLVNDERNLAAYVASMTKVPPAARQRAGRLLVVFPKALMGHLRAPAGGPRPGAEERHEPSALSASLFAELEQWRRQDWIDGWEWSRLALLSESLLSVCGGCERIKASALTRSYHYVIMACGGLYLAAAPLVLHSRSWTVPLVMTVATFFFALEQVATDIDEPFGTAPEDLPLERLCVAIGGTVEQILGGSDPTAAMPVSATDG